MSAQRVFTSLILWFLITGCRPDESYLGNTKASLYQPGLTWQMLAPDRHSLLEGKVHFVHESSDSTIITSIFKLDSMHYGFRFTPALPGQWRFTTRSEVPAFNHKQGTIEVSENAAPNHRGFVGHYENKWIWKGSGKAFVPQLVMYRGLQDLGVEYRVFEKELDSLLMGHGFTGIHIPSVAMGWFDHELGGKGYDQLNQTHPKPDPESFNRLERLILEVYERGGMTHLWMWGDESRKQTPLKWGANGTVDRQLQAYLAARLGPLPGWTMGYGFDLFEWTDKQMLEKWHEHMHEQLPYPHLLGARGNKNELMQIYEGLDYVSYEQHQPDYRLYRKSLALNPHRPVFSEDRFRIRHPSKYPEKDYQPDLVRRGLWESTLAGGVANIWGYLVKDDSSGNLSYSRSFPNRGQIKTYSTFFFQQNRFHKQMVADSSRCPGIPLLLHPQTGAWVAYASHCNRIACDSLPNAHTYIAVDTRESYREIKVTNQYGTILLPYFSDWALYGEINIQP